MGRRVSIGWRRSIAWRQSVRRSVGRREGVGWRRSIAWRERRCECISRSWCIRWCQCIRRCIGRRRCVGWGRITITKSDVAQPIRLPVVGINWGMQPGIGSGRRRISVNVCTRTAFDNHGVYSKSRAPVEVGAAHGKRYRITVAEIIGATINRLDLLSHRAITQIRAAGIEFNCWRGGFRWRGCLRGLGCFSWCRCFSWCWCLRRVRCFGWRGRLGGFGGFC